MLYWAHILDLTLAPGLIVFHLPDLLFSPSFVLLCIRLNNKNGANLKRCTNTVGLTWAIIGRLYTPASLNHAFPEKGKTNPILSGWFDSWIYRSAAVWYKNIRSPWSVPLNGPWVSQWKCWQCHIDHGHTLLFYWAGLNKIIARRLRARQGRVNCSDLHREARPHFPERK